MFAYVAQIKVQSHVFNSCNVVIKCHPMFWLLKGSEDRLNKTALLVETCFTAQPVHGIKADALLRESRFQSLSFLTQEPVPPPPPPHTSDLLSIMGALPISQIHVLPCSAGVNMVSYMELALLYTLLWSNKSCRL